MTEKITQETSTYWKLPDYYSQLPFPLYKEVYNKFYNRQEKDRILEEKKLQDLELKVFEDEFSLIDSDIEELKKISFHPKNITDTLKIWNRDYKGLPTYYEEVGIDER